MGSYVEHEHDPFIKRVSHVNSNMTRTHLVSTHDLFINELIVLDSQVVSDFAIPNSRLFWIFFKILKPKFVIWLIAFSYHI